ncbi:hypothetical protein PMAYCL1PPCAC_16585, partial [Pristionchus mayeri]
RVLLAIVGCATLFGGASATCAAADNVNCPTWIKSGFCDNYSPVTLAVSCPKSCPKAGCGATAVPSTGTNTTTVTENANCAKWNNDPKNGFCATATADQKKIFCKTTCAAEIAAVDDCAVFVQTGDKSVRTGGNRTTTIKTAATTTNLLMNVFAKEKCTVGLYSVEAPAATDTVIKSYGPATAPSQYFKITVAAEQAAKGVTCMCT